MIPNLQPQLNRQITKNSKLLQGVVVRHLHVLYRKSALFLNPALPPLIPKWKGLTFSGSLSSSSTTIGSAAVPGLPSAPIWDLGSKIDGSTPILPTIRLSSSILSGRRVGRGIWDGMVTFPFSSRLSMFPIVNKSRRAG